MNDIVKRFKFPETIYKFGPKGKKLPYPIASGTYYRIKYIDIKVRLERVTGDNYKEALIKNSLFRLGVNIHV